MTPTDGNGYNDTFGRYTHIYQKTFYRLLKFIKLGNEYSKWNWLTPLHQIKIDLIQRNKFQLTVS